MEQFRQPTNVRNLINSEHLIVIAVCAGGRSFFFFFFLKKSMNTVFKSIINCKGLLL